MASLSDTPTSAVLPSVANEISIKIEQGVLCENGKDIGSKGQLEARYAPILKCESNFSSTTENILNGMNEDFNISNTTNSIFQNNYAIKTEPDMEIDDRQPEEEAEHLQSSNNFPNIKVTPTSKLVATANGSSDKKRRYFCTYENCTKSYGKSSHLRSHLTWHTGIKPFVCKEASCGKGFTRSDELNRHIRTHTGEKPFECVQCTKKFSRSDHLTKHLATHTKQLSAQSGLLSKKSKLEKNLLPSILKIVPPALPSIINGNQNLDCEKTTCDGKIKQEEPDNSSMVPILSEETDLNSCTSASDQKPKIENKVVIKPEPIEEPQVSQLPHFWNEPDDDAIMPEANLPPLTGNESYMSVVKVQESPLIKESIKHIEDSVYDPTRPFPCCHCAKNFKRQDDLNRHMRTHTGEKPFACSECDKRFMRSDHLKKHVKIHSKTR